MTTKKNRRAPLLLPLAALAFALVGCASEVDREPGPDEGRNVEVEVDEKGLEPRYPSTYSSNCTCSFCIAYCVVNGTTQKSGACC